MTDIHTYPGFREAVLESSEDFEPYGYTTAQLQPTDQAPHDWPSGYARERVIEQAVLANRDYDPY